MLLEKRAVLLPEDLAFIRRNAGATYVLASTNKKFSDWVFDKSPTEEVFLRNVINNKKTLIFSKEIQKSISRHSNRRRQEDKGDALKTFGGQTKGLRQEQLQYLSLGRTTGKKVEGFGVKPGRLKLSRR